MQSFHLRLGRHQLELKQHLAEAKPKFTLHVQTFFPISSIRKLKEIIEWTISLQNMRYFIPIFQTSEGKQF